MPTRDARAFLHDVFTSGKTFESYLGDELLRSAVERQLAIIGEAVAKLDKVDSALANRLLDSPQIVAFRNRLIHDYGQVDHAIVWGVVSAKIPLLRERLKAILEASG